MQALCHWWTFEEKDYLLPDRRSSDGRRWYIERQPYVATQHKPLWLSFPEIHIALYRIGLMKLIGVTLSAERQEN